MITPEARAGRCGHGTPTRTSAKIANPRVFLKLSGKEGSLDGATVDAARGSCGSHTGRLELTRHDPTGRTERVVQPSSAPTCPAFGGAGLDVLYVTSATIGLSPEALAACCGWGLLALDPGVLEPEVRFAG